jgi:hypothetical protein
VPFKDSTEVQQSPKVNQHMLGIQLAHAAAAAVSCRVINMHPHALQHALQLSCHLSAVNNQQRLCLGQQQPLLELHVHQPVWLQPLQLHAHAVCHHSIPCI